VAGFVSQLLARLGIKNGLIGTHFALVVNWDINLEQQSQN
jgi:hypothetical protein